MYHVPATAKIFFGIVNMFFAGSCFRLLPFKFIPLIKFTLFHNNSLVPFSTKVIFLWFGFWFVFIFVLLFPMIHSFKLHSMWKCVVDKLQENFGISELISKPLFNLSVCISVMYVIRTLNAMEMPIKWKKLMNKYEYLLHFRPLNVLSSQFMRILCWSNSKVIPPIAIDAKQSMHSAYSSITILLYANRVWSRMKPQTWKRIEKILKDHKSPNNKRAQEAIGLRPKRMKTKLHLQYYEMKILQNIIWNVNLSFNYEYVGSFLFRIECRFLNWMVWTREGVEEDEIALLNKAHRLIWTETCKNSS